MMVERSARRALIGLLAAAVAIAGISLPASAQTAPTKPAAPAAAAAADPTAPQTTTATYQDWVVRCATPQGGAKVCEAVQGVQVQGQQGLVAQIVLGRLKKEDPVRLIIELPRGVWLQGAVTVQTSEKAAPMALPYTRCLNGCLAELELKNDQLNALKAAEGPGIINFVDGTQQKVQLPLSFKGFSAALAASLAN